MSGHKYTVAELEAEPHSPLLAPKDTTHYFVLTEPSHGELVCDRLLCFRHKADALSYFAALVGKSAAEESEDDGPDLAVLLQNQIASIRSSYTDEGTRDLGELFEEDAKKKNYPLVEILAEGYWDRFVFSAAWRLAECMEEFVRDRSEDLYYEHEDDEDADVQEMIETHEDMDEAEALQSWLSNVGDDKNEDIHGTEFVRRFLAACEYAASYC